MKNKIRISRRNFVGTAAAAGTAFTLNPGFAFAGSSGNAGKDNIAAHKPAAATTDLSVDPYPSVHIPDFRIADGPFKPNWESLRKGYTCPEWFRDAKFGIWAHWGPQCVPEAGDWYARGMYTEGSEQYKYHLEHYGHPSEFGSKDICHLWRAEKWDPDRLIQLYKRAGAKYFTAMASHHDNFDAWDSKYQPWNSVRVGPKKDIIGLWAAAARREGLPFGVTYHVSAGRVWREFMPVKYGSDKNGPRAGIPYDGRVTRADGKGTWWDGMYPQDLYGPVHTVDDPCPEFVQQYLMRVDDLIRQHHPDIICLDEALEFAWDGIAWLGMPDLAPQIAAHYYNLNLDWNAGKLKAVLNLKGWKGAPPWIKNAFVADTEMDWDENMRPAPWQNEDCLMGTWHYQRDQGYRSAESVIHELVDIVSKNGNLLLNVPLPGSGAIDDAAVSILEEIGRWLDINGEAIYGSRPWKKFSEEQIRFTTKPGAIYASSLGVPAGEVKIKSLAGEKIARVQLIGSNQKIEWRQTADELVIKPVSNWPSPHAVVFRIDLIQ